MAKTVNIGMAGQSNEINWGQGSFNENAGTANDYRIYQIGRAPWHPDMAPVLATEPLDHVGRGTGHGSGMETLRYFARKVGNLAAADTLLAVPGAAGGTSILQWNNIDPYTLRTAPFDLNADFMARMDVAMAQPNPFLAFIRWTQSEADIKHIGDADNGDMTSGADYGAQFQTLVSTWRARYGTVPIIWVPPPPGIAVKQPQYAAGESGIVAAMNGLLGVLPHFAIVDTHDLKDNSSVDPADPSGPFHYTAEAQEFIALRTVYTAYPAALAN